MMTVDFVHHGEDGDHNVSGMVTTAMRLVNSVHAVCDASPGLVARQGPAPGDRPRTRAPVRAPARPDRPARPVPSL